MCGRTLVDTFRARRPRREVFLLPAGVVESFRLLLRRDRGAHLRGGHAGGHPDWLADWLRRAR